MQLVWSARTDSGLRRSSNEDGWCVREDLGLFAVTDGMGGHVAGEVASRLVLEQLEHHIEDTHPAQVDAQVTLSPTPDILSGPRLDAGLLEANQCLARESARDSKLQGMATTAVAVLIHDTGNAVAHVGDSRAYVYHRGELSRLTADHSWVEDQVRAGLLSTENARNHPHRNIVTRAIAGTEGLSVESSKLSLQAGDRLLLCSDGLTTVVSDSEIEAILTSNLVPGTACDELIDRANEEGGPDNTTAIVVDIL